MLNCPRCHTGSKFYSQHNTYICPKCGVCFNSQTALPLSEPELSKPELFNYQLSYQSLSLLNSSSVPPLSSSRILLEKQLCKYLNIYNLRLFEINKVLDANKTLYQD
jgi:hypothetical protein